MANLTQVLEGLNTKEAAVSTTDLAGELKASIEGTRKQLTRLKERGYIDGDSKEGWLITDAGRKALEKGEVRPSMVEEGVTPREKFEAIARRIGITEDRIALAADIVWSGDYTDVKWVWEALGQADIRDDLRKIWVNSWRAFLQKGIPPELEVELTGLPPGAEGGKPGEAVRPKAPARDYIILDEQPVRVGEGLGDYSLQDAKDILAIRALRGRFAGVAGQAGGQPPGVAEKVSEVLTALGPYINKGSDLDTLKEVISDKLALQRQEILSHIPQSLGQPAQPKSIIEQITDFVGAIGSLKEAGPTLRSILGIPESSSSNPPPGVPVQITGPDGKPIVMDLGNIINWRKFEGDERRADERHGALIGLAQTVRENLGDGILALKAAAQEIKSTGAKTPTASPQLYECADCHTRFAVPDVPFEKVACPSCHREYTKEELGA